MLKKKLSCILAVITATSIFSTVGFAQTEEKKLFGDTFENGLNSEIWNIMPDSGLGEVRSDQIKYLKTSATENAEFTYEYSAEKEDVSFDISVNAAEWKQDGEAFEVYVRYVDAANYFKLNIHSVKRYIYAFKMCRWCRNTNHNSRKAACGRYGL